MTGSSPSWKSPRTLRDAGQARNGAREHGHLRVLHPCPGRTSSGAMPPSWTRAAISARTSSRTWSTNGKAVAHRFTNSCVRSSSETEAYWRDVGTLDAYWAANIDLTHARPQLDLYDEDWPIWTNAEITPPAKVIHDDGQTGGGDRFPPVRRLHRHRGVDPAVAAVHRHARSPRCQPRGRGLAAERRDRPVGEADRRSSLTVACASRKASWSGKTRPSMPSASGAARPGCA